MDAAISGHREKGGSMTTRTSPTGRILVGVDGSPASVAAVRWAAREAQLRGMRVHVVHVRDRRVPAPAYYAPRPRAGDAEADWPAEKSAVTTVLREALGSEPWAGVQTELADGLPARELIERAAGAEMLVLGSAQAGPAPVQARTPLGPVARDCLRGAPCPVVVVRASGVRSPAQPAGVR
jgi:nucleotide-binding universal stress UspA family protein